MTDEKNGESLQNPDHDGRELSDEEQEAMRQLAERLADGETLQEALEVQDEYVKVMEAMAHRLYMNGKFEEAQIMVEGVLALDDQRHYPYLLIGTYLLEEQENYEKAIESLLVAHELGPEEPGIAYKLAEALWRDGRNERSIPFFEAAVAWADDEENPYRKRAEVVLERLREAVESRGAAN